MSKDISLPLELKTHIDTGYLVNENTHQYNTTYTYTKTSTTKQTKTLNKPIVNGTSVYLVYNDAEVPLHKVENGDLLSDAVVYREFEFSTDGNDIEHIRYYIDIGADSKSVGIYTDTYYINGTMSTEESVRLQSFQSPVSEVEDFDINDYYFVLVNGNVQPHTDTVSWAYLTFEGIKVIDGKINFRGGKQIGDIALVKAETFYGKSYTTTISQRSRRTERS